MAAQTIRADDGAWVRTLIIMRLSCCARDPPHAHACHLRPPTSAVIVAGAKHASTSGIGSAHKVANAVYHLQATRCFATGCHPCVVGASYAAILEDDVQFVDGVSPGTPRDRTRTSVSHLRHKADVVTGSAAAFPQLLARSMADALRLERNKLHLSLSHSTIVNGSGARVPHKRCEADWPGHKWASGSAAGGAAMILRCLDFSDSHSYVTRSNLLLRCVASLHRARQCRYRYLLTRELARKITGAQETLLREGARIAWHGIRTASRTHTFILCYAVICQGKRTKRCTNPWGSRTCASDPGVLDSFFQASHSRAIIAAAASCCAVLCCAVLCYAMLDSFLQGCAKEPRMDRLKARSMAWTRIASHRTGPYAMLCCARCARAACSRRGWCRARRAPPAGPLHQRATSRYGLRLARCIDATQATVSPRNVRQAARGVGLHAVGPEARDVRALPQQLQQEVGRGQPHTKTQRGARHLVS